MAFGTAAVIGGDLLAGGAAVGAGALAGDALAGGLAAGGAMDMGVGLGGSLGSFGGITPLAGAAGGGLSLSDLSLINSGANLVSGLAGSNAAQQAARLQANAANSATAGQLQMFNTLNTQSQPYRQAGTNALPSLLTGIGLPTSSAVTPSNFDARAYLAANPDVAADPYFGTHPYEHFLQYGQQELTAGGNNRTLGFQIPVSNALQQFGGNAIGSLVKPFQASDLNANLAPNWAFALQQGQGAAANALNATGGMGGNYGKGLVDYTLNKSGDLYQQAFGNYTANQANIFNRLASIAGLGQTANQQAVQSGVGLAPGIAQTTVGAGQAQAAGTVGSYNALAGGLQNAGSWYALPALLNAGGANA